MEKIHATSDLPIPPSRFALKAALREALAETAYQRCYVHFLRNALDHVPRRVDDDCLQELRWLGAHSGDCDRPFRPKVITDSGDRDHAVTRPIGSA